MRTQQQDAPGRLQRITGRINSSGTVTAGVGFTVAKTGTGTYVIRLQGGSRAIVGVSVVGDYGNPSTVGTGFPAADSFTVYTGNAGGTATDTGFWFDATLRV